MTTKQKTTKNKPTTKKTTKKTTKSNKSLKKGLVFDKWVVLVIVVLVGVFGGFFVYRSFALGASDGPYYRASQMQGGNPQGSDGKGGPAERGLGKQPVYLGVIVPNGYWNICVNGKGSKATYIELLAVKGDESRKFKLSGNLNGGWTAMQGSEVLDGEAWWTLYITSPAYLNSTTIRQVALTSVVNGRCPDGSLAK